ncbi:MAG: hypothetical protein WBS33_03475 [Verrucomicrobiia bacterium]
MAETLLTVKRLPRARPSPVVLFNLPDAPEELEFLQGSKSQMDPSLIQRADPAQLSKELAGVEWCQQGVSQAGIYVH